jgi:hypothetical protein
MKLVALPASRLSRLSQHTSEGEQILSASSCVLVTLIWSEGLSRRMGLERVVWLILIGRQVHSSRGARGLEAAT